MRKGFFPVLVLVLLINTWEINGQQLDTSSSHLVPERQTALRVLFNKVLVYFRDGSYLSGLLVGVENNLLVLRTKGQDEKIPLNNLVKVIIETDKETNRYALYGMLMGTYLGNIIFHRAENQPTAYMEDFDGTLGFLLINTLYAAAGIGLGYLASSMFEESKRVFDFTGSEGKRQAAWDRFRRFVIGGDFGPKKVHISIQAGHVYTRVSSRYETLLQNVDYSTGRGGVSNFNLLRKLQFTISPTSNAEIGLALYWLGEPRLYGNKYHCRAWQSLYTNGYYIVGIYKPFVRQLPKYIDWNVGMGVGAAKVDFSLETEHWTGYPTYSRETSEYNIYKIFFSGLVFAELNLYLHNTLSVGLVADYVFVPPKNVPEIPEADIPEQKLRLGNSSIGFTLGMHF